MAGLGRLKRLLLGNPIASKHAHQEKLPKRIALPVFASDALSSVAYATEEIMHIFQHHRALHLLQLTLNLSIAIAILIVIVSISYVQTIYAYPGGGGSYTVAKENLGHKVGKVAGASLLIDYTLTVAVSISAGVAAIVSIAPGTQPYVIPMCLGAIGFITMANLRGAKESGVLFAIPTYAFILMMFGLLIKGAMTPPLPFPQEILDAKANPPEDLVGLAYFFMLARAFSAGCTALTGIEAISNGTGAFKQPVSRNASITLALMSLILGTLFVGMSWLGERFHAMPMKYGEEGFKTVSAQIAAAAFGDGHWYFYGIQIATAAILLLAANTAYADFPRLTSIIAKDGYLPRQLNALGDKLVFQNGILTLAVGASILVVAFKGTVTLLVPLYAVGVFLCFTLSQFGMVVHERRNKRPFASVALSFVGGTITGIVTIIIFVTKFKEGAWLVLIAATAIYWIFGKIRGHYNYLAEALTPEPTDTVPEIKGTVLLLVPRVHRGILQAIAYAKTMSRDVRALHVTLDSKSAETIKKDWNQWGSGLPLVILESPYRSFVEPITEYIDQALAEDPDHTITVIVPQAIPKHWYQSLLHNNVAVSLKYALGARKNVVVTNVRYFLS